VCSVSMSWSCWLGIVNSLFQNPANECLGRTIVFVEPWSLRISALTLVHLQPCKQVQMQGRGQRFRRAFGVPMQLEYRSKRRTHTHTHTHTFTSSIGLLFAHSTFAGAIPSQTECLSTPVQAWIQTPAVREIGSRPSSML